jgi:hypothetical protein
MDKKENLKFILEMNRGIIQKLTGDITEQESIDQAGTVINHIKWQIAHLAFYVDWLIEKFGGEKTLTDEWAEICKGGADVPDNSMFPSFEELRSLFFKLYDRLTALIEKADDAYLDEVLELSPNFKSSRMNAAIYIGTHEQYHSGQIVVIRKALGRERVLG